MAIQRMIITDFHHQPGHHCASTALADVMRHQGHTLSEAMCFGLGAGLGFVYVKMPEQSPSRIIGVRTLYLEANFFENLLGSFQWRENSRFPWSEMQAFLDDNVPILLLTDLYYLPHYGKSVHFPGHGVALCGYDTDEAGQPEIAYVADTHFPDLKPVPLSDLAAAMDSPLPPIPVRNNWHPVEPFTLPDLAGPIAKALRANALAMLNPPTNAYGIAGMEMAVQRVTAWSQAEDWPWAARFAYQIIERRGTGGGAFRKIYAQFLAESLPFVPQLVGIGALAQMETIAQKWTALSDSFKAISEQDAPDGFEQAAEMLAELAVLEKQFFEAVLNVVGGRQ